MIVPVLICASACVEKNPQRFSSISSESDRARMKIPEETNSLSMDEKHSTWRDRRDDLKNQALNERKLAEKFAKEVLDSQKTQETIRNLTRIKIPPPQRNPGHMVKVVTVVAPKNSPTKSTAHPPHRTLPRKARRKKKRKRHHGRLGSRRRSKSGGTAKKNSDTRRSAKSKTQKHSVATVSGKTSRVATTEEKEYVDFTTAKSSSRKIKHVARSGGSQSMVERIMRTTTKPRKPPGDQGMEYSDYYSDEDILEDMVANKIPMKISEPKDSNDRFIRQTIDNSSFLSYDPIVANPEIYAQDFQADDGSSSIENYQNYPPIDKYPMSNENFQFPQADADPWSNYVPSDEPIFNDDPENLDVSYPSAEEISNDRRVFEPVTVADFRESLVDPSEAKGFDNNKIQQPVILPQYQLPGNFDVLNPLSKYEKPVEENFNVFDDPASLDGNSQQFSEKFNLPLAESYKDVPEASNVDLDASIESMRSLDHDDPRNSAVDPRLMKNFNIPDRAADYASGRAKISRMKEEEKQRYSGKQDFSDFRYNRFPKAEAERFKSFSLQTPGPSDPVDLSNAMNQPFGKVLARLGINVNEKSSRKLGRVSSRNINAMKKIQSPSLYVSGRLTKPTEYILSPNHVESKIEKTARRHLKNGDSAFASRNRNRDFEKRLSRQEKPLRHKTASNDLLSFMEEERNAAAGSNVMANQTKEVASQILGTIIDELEEIKLSHGKNDAKDGLPCRVTGTWLTAQTGMTLEMNVVNHTVIAKFSTATSTRFRESFLNETWNVTGHMPLKRGAPFTLTAIDSRTNSVAIFLGSCRVCQGIDTIAGVWSVARQPKDCRDFEIATSVFNDVFRKTRLSSMKQDRCNVARVKLDSKHSMDRGNATKNNEKKRHV